MTGLVDDLLDVSRITRGQIALDAGAVDLAHGDRRRASSRRAR